MSIKSLRVIWWGIAIVNAVVAVFAVWHYLWANALVAILLLGITAYLISSDWGD